MELTSHVMRRAEQRGFTETDLRRMLQEARDLREDWVPGRWVVETSHGGRPWEVVVEPDTIERVVVVVTAYPVDRR